MSWGKRAGLVIVAMITTVGVVACGFVGASQSAHVKPDGFLLYGHAAVRLPSNDHRADGTECVSPAAASDVAAGAPVTVLDPAGKTLAVSGLDSGVMAHDNAVPTCDFSFSIPAVPGGVDSYRIQIASRPAQTFPALDLRRNSPAIITITP